MAITQIPFMLNPSLLATADLPTVFTLPSPAQVTISAGNGRGGGASLRFTTTGNADCSAGLVLPPSPTWSIASALKLSRIPTAGSNPTPLVKFYDGGILQVTIGIVITTGLISAFRGDVSGTLLGTTSAGMSTAVQDHYEFQTTIHPTAGTVKIWKNSTLILNLSSQNTRNSTNNSINALRFGLSGSSAGESPMTLDYSDFHIADDQVGDQKITILSPTGPGTTTQFTNTGGSANWDSVDDTTQDGDTTFVSSNTVNQLDTYAMSDLASSSNILAVGAWICAKKTDAGTRQGQPQYRIGATNYSGASIFPASGNYGFFQDNKLVSPASAIAWTPAEVNAMEFGVKVSA